MRTALAARIGVLSLVGAVVVAAPVSADPASDLFISEYIEGSSNNKALEIYNGTGSDVDLADYAIAMYFNGSTSAGTTLPLSGIILAGDVYVVADNDAEQAILDQADFTPTSSFFNGDDAIVLIHDAAVIDSLGQVGFDPGSQWGTGLVSTQDNTLRRLPSVCTGDTDTSDIFDPAVEWDGFDNNTFDGLGTHTATCGGGPVGDVAPTVASVSPADGTTGVNASSNVFVSFSEEVEAAGAFALECSLSGTVALTVTGGPTDFTLDPSADLAVGEDCTLTVSAAAVTDVDADDPPDAMAADFTSAFTVSAGATLIGAVQGSGAASPLVGQNVTIEGVVVGDYEGASPALRGFYVQSADDNTDGDPATSDGIFVFHGADDTVSLGDLVSVTGVVSEYQGQTQLGYPSDLTVLDTGQTVTAATVALPFASADSAEAYEGMLVSFPQDLYVTEFYQQGRSGEVVVSSSARLQQPTAVAAPGADAQAVQAANDLNRITIDDATNSQNADPVFGEGGNPLTAANPLRGGDTVTGLVGVMTYTWGGYSSSPNAYRVRPIGDLSDTGLVPGGGVPVFAATNPRPVAPDEVGGSLKVASFNVLNYFLTLDASGSTCGPVGSEQDCRGAENAEEFDRQRTKLVAALQALDADVIALMELENTPGVDPAADLAAGLNAAEGGTAWESIDTGVLGTDVIRVGIVFRGDLVRPSGDFTVMDSSVDPRFDDNRNRPSLGQTFVQMNGSENVTLVVNHLKSKGSCPGDGSADDDAGDGAGCWNATRTAAAEALIDWIDAGQAGNGDPDVVLMGDMNSYAMEDPIQTFISAGYADLSLGNYSYVFDGQWGYLDYALASPSLQPQVTGVTEFHINADEVPVLDYNTNFQTPWQIENLYAPDMYRTSDHDPVVLGMDLDSGVTWAVDPSTVSGPEHSLVDVDVTATGPDGSPWTVTIINALSTQADDGLGAGDLPGDASIVDGDTATFRVESYGADARLYLLNLEAVGPNGERIYQSLELPVEVVPVVPFCQVRYSVHATWRGLFVGQVSFKNTSGERINGWNLEWDLGARERILALWGGDVTQTGSHVAVENLRWNRTLRPGETRALAFLGAHAGPVSVPDSFTLNGQPCEVVG